ncbi:MAG: single-stranded DNA-binding protein [Nannocystaceae bacterium]
MDINIAIISGNLGRDPEYRETQGGKSVCRLSVASSRRWRDPNGNEQEETQWHRVVVWGRQAEHCRQHLHKGSSVLVEGHLNTSRFDDSEGHTRFITEIVANFVRFLGPKGTVRRDRGENDRAD